MEQEFPLNYDMVYINCLEAAERVGFNIRNENLTEGIIYFNAGASWRSFGEIIEVKLLKLTESLTKVQVNSQLSTSFQLFSWDKNSENEANFIRTLKNLFK